ncbi:MAG: hypothetical protein IT380_10225 [Myxococcales bacterium]|nr:hypothetical protein [Myxococcales bacterium]
MIPSNQHPLTLGRGATLALLLAASLAHAHPQGFHKKLTFTLTKTTVTGLLVMDVDSGDRCTVLRQAADANGDGLLQGAEVTALKERLASMAAKTLKLSISGAAIAVTAKETKLSLREDPRVGEAGLSVALLIELAHPHPVSEGMTFEVTDTSPDLSPVVVQVFQAAAKGAAPEAPFQGEVESGKTVKVRLGRLP